MVPLTLEGYQNQFWSMLREALDTMLSKAPGTYEPISYEQMYSAVYKCVCKQYSGQLYGDLMDHIAHKHLKAWHDHLSSLPDSEGHAQFISEFHKALVQYFHAIGSIVPIFTYMNRFYIESKLHTDLRTELLKLFCKHVSDLLIRRLLELLNEAQNNPFSISPDVMQSILKNLNALNSNYCQLSPELFSRHLVGVTAPMSEEDLSAQREADQRLQNTLRNSGFNTSNPNKKRLNDEFDQPEIVSRT